MPANRAAWPLMESGAHALDVVEEAARHAELDLDVQSVGRGGLPDSSGHVTLDAAITDGIRGFGAVAALSYTTHAVSVARRVMERTKHVMLAGAGADAFARAQGFPQEELLTDKARARYAEYLVGHPVGREMPNEEPWHKGMPKNGHDTIGVLARDAAGRIAVACTTSGTAWKLPGRVGDSPIFGAGLYADQEIGAAVATGTGELMMKSCATAVAVEMLRQGRTPREAAEEAIRRVRRLAPEPDMQCGIIVLRRDGEYGDCCVRAGFQVAVRMPATEELRDSLPLPL